ncbi:hypothetical protein [Antrihabitans stalactiti]|uniref:Uncharacterized protein n=1 Tax=Antrihabitans stalactiti TaxID=2584121 RepID=A0A848K8Z1_9NOCA|nr:hypothetical protein [Antrihabitans stalactiti]NMN94819.1 hypothetical protein [Antrihabitans stalactiti]
MVVKEMLDKCPLDGSLPDGTCRYVGRADRGKWGTVCKKHADRIDKYGDPYASPLPGDSKEPSFEEIMRRRLHGDLNRNAD